AAACSDRIDHVVGYPRVAAHQACSLAAWPMDVPLGRYPTAVAQIAGLERRAKYRVRERTQCASNDRAPDEPSSAAEQCRGHTDSKGARQAGQQALDSDPAGGAGLHRL